MSTDETKFLNSLFLKNLIENKYDESQVQIKKFSVEPIGIHPNNTLRSSLKRILIKYASQSSSENRISLIAKIKPINGPLGEMFKNCQFFENETHIYKKVIPNMNQILKTIGKKYDFGNDLLHSSEVPSDILIFEDMEAYGFKLKDQQNGLDFNAGKFTIEKLAHFHAASVIMLNENETGLSRYNNIGTFHDSNKNGLTYFNNAFKLLVKIGPKLGVNDDILKKLKSLTPKIVDRAIQDYSASLNGFEVLNHGDFWTGNLLYRYNKTEVSDVIFLDYQNTVVGSPIIDLIYFIATSISYDVTESERDEIIFVYHDTLSTVLQNLGYTGYIPSLSQLQIELLKRGALELIYMITTAPYLRTRHSSINPSTQPSHCNNDYIKFDENKAEIILEMHQAGIRSQLKRFNSLGLLDWGAAASKVKRLLGNFQK